jgi:hypothetical protein
VLPDGVEEFRGTTQPCSFMYQKSLNDLPEEFPLDESITFPLGWTRRAEKKRVAYIIHYWRGDWMTQGEWERGGKQKSRSAGRASASLHATPSRARPALPDFWSESARSIRGPFSWAYRDGKKKPGGAGPSRCKWVDDNFYTGVHKTAVATVVTSTGLLSCRCLHVS